jgi:hypothetical protein
LRAGDAGEIAVEGAEWNMTSFAREVEHQAIGEAERGLCAEQF